MFASPPLRKIRQKVDPEITVSSLDAAFSMRLAGRAHGSSEIWAVSHSIR